MHLITGGFDFDRTDFVHTCDQEIYLALVFAVIGLEGVVEKTVSRSCEYLRYYIFKKVSQMHSALANGRICGANRPCCGAKQPKCRKETAE